MQIQTQMQIQIQMQMQIQVQTQTQMKMNNLSLFTGPRVQGGREEGRAVHPEGEEVRRVLRLQGQVRRGRLQGDVLRGDVLFKCGLKIVTALCAAVLLMSDVLQSDTNMRNLS